LIFDGPSADCAKRRRLDPYCDTLTLLGYMIDECGLYNYVINININIWC